MAARTPSADSERGTRRGPAARLRANWLGGIRISGFSVIMLLVVVLAITVIAPSVTSLVGQRSQIAELERQVRDQRADVAEIEAQQQLWGDESYLRAQARERLYYVLPGETSYLVIDDRPGGGARGDGAPVSKDVTRDETDWTSSLLASLVAAGTAPAPSPTPDTPATEAPQ